jgi:hypothetical protein
MSSNIKSSYPYVNVRFIVHRCIGRLVLRQKRSRQRLCALFQPAAESWRHTNLLRLVRWRISRSEKSTVSGKFQPLKRFFTRTTIFEGKNKKCNKSKANLVTNYTRSLALALAFVAIAWRSVKIMKLLIAISNGQWQFVHVPLCSFDLTLEIVFLLLKRTQMEYVMSVTVSNLHAMYQPSVSMPLAGIVPQHPTSK